MISALEITKIKKQQKRNENDETYSINSKDYRVLFLDRVEKPKWNKVRMKQKCQKNIS